MFRSPAGEATARAEYFGFHREHESLREILARNEGINHAFGLRTSVHRVPGSENKVPVLIYLYAEPEWWPDGRLVRLEHIVAHRQETEKFAEIVAGDEVRFVALSYRKLLDIWKQAEAATVRAHAVAVETVFSP
jgi:hypothetical protein